MRYLLFGEELYAMNSERIYFLNNPTNLVSIAYVNQIEDKAAAHGDWESSGILDVSRYFGDGSWLVDVQAHTIDEGGQLLLLRIPGS
jgi:hypothetical protein